jgi:hypothetical protein
VDQYWRRTAANDGEIEVFLGHAAEGLAAVLRTERRRFYGRVAWRASEASLSLSARDDPPRKTSGEDTAMSEERTVDAKSRIKRGSERAGRASTAAAERARETSKVAQQWWGRARHRIAKQTSAGVEFGRLKREQLKRQREIAGRERSVGRIVSILHARLEGPIPLEPELAHELEALAEAQTHLEAVSERLAAGRPADRKS